MSVAVGMVAAHGNLLVRTKTPMHDAVGREGHPRPHPGHAHHHFLFCKVMIYIHVLLYLGLPLSDESFTRVNPFSVCDDIILR